MRWISMVLGAVLLVAVAAQPAGAGMVFATHWGFADAPKYATTATFMEIFLTHENGTVYRANTGAWGVTRVEVPDGIIWYCRVYEEARLIVSWSCYIPVGEKALRKVLASATRGTPPGALSFLDALPWMRQGGGPDLADLRGQNWYPPSQPRILLVGTPGEEREKFIRERMAKGWTREQAEAAAGYISFGTTGPVAGHGHPETTASTTIAVPTGTGENKQYIFDPRTQSFKPLIRSPEHSEFITKEGAWWVNWDGNWDRVANIFLPPRTGRYATGGDGDGDGGE